MKNYKNCQSCGMPMSKDPEKGGSELDGSKSLKYCSYCYSGGKFSQPDMTINEMKTLVKNQMKKMGFPSLVAGIFTIGIPKLDRWKN